TVAGSYTVAVAVAGGSNPTGSFSLTNLPDVPHSIVLAGDNQSTIVNTAFGSPLVVTVLDQYGNAVGSGYSVTLTAPNIGASGLFSNNAVTITLTTDALGQVSDLFTANTVAGSYTVAVAVAGGSNPTGSFSLTNLPDVPHSIVLSGDNQSTIVNTAFGSPLVVTVLDQYGNAVGAGYTVTLTAPGSGASISGSNTLTLTTNASGQASASVSANTVAGSYTVAVAVAGGSNPTGSFSLTNLAAAPANITVSGGGQSTQVNTAFGNQIVVTVTDQYGNPVPGVTVVFFLPTAGASGTLSGGITGVTNAAGQVVKTLTANTVAGTYNIGVVAVGGVNPSVWVGPLTNTPGPLAQISFLVAPPTTVTANTPISPPVRVILKDQYGNRILQGGVQVRLWLVRPNNTVSPNLSGGPRTVTTNVNGLARFLNLVVTQPGNYKWRVRVIGQPIPAILSSTFTVTP
ncbi:MAG: Ig-like domain-containing protein, partial [Thermogemmata sp.]|nr:Ig-like domain-containing protein [Thermogemmata sp.]